MDNIYVYEQQISGKKKKILKYENAYHVWKFTFLQLLLVESNVIQLFCVSL